MRRGSLVLVNATDIVVFEDIAYVSAGGLWVVDVSDPMSPDVLGNIDTTNSQGLDLEGDRVYLAGGHDVLRVFDVSDPSQPQQVGFYDFGTFNNDVAVRHGIAFVAADGLYVIDFSNPAVPNLIGWGDYPNGAEYVEISDGIVYVTGESPYGLACFDACNMLVFADSFEIGSTIFWE